MLEKSLESPLDSKEIEPVQPKGNQSWIVIGKTDVEAEATVFGHLMQRTASFVDSDIGKDWNREEKGTTKDQMVGWHHWLNGHEFE